MLSKTWKIWIPYADFEEIFFQAIKGNDLIPILRKITVKLIAKSSPFRHSVRSIFQACDQVCNRQTIKFRNTVYIKSDSIVNLFLLNVDILHIQFSILALELTHVVGKSAVLIGCGLTDPLNPQN